MTPCGKGSTRVQTSSVVSPGLIVKVMAPLLFPPVPYPLLLQSNPSGSKYLLNKSSWSRHWNPPILSSLLASVPTLDAPFYMRLQSFTHSLCYQHVPLILPSYFLHPGPLTRNSAHHFSAVMPSSVCPSIRGRGRWGETGRRD